MSVEAPARPRMLTRQQVADWLSVNQRWLIDHMDDGPPFLRLAGRTVRYPEDELEAWLKQQPKS